MEKRLIESLGIYELRTLARKVGVQSPTTKKREELIELINQQMLNGENGSVQTKKGRPPKNLSSTDEFFNKLVSDKKEIVTELTFRSRESKNIIDCNASGIIEFGQDYYFKNRDKMRAFNVINLPHEFIEQNNLVVGDFIEVIATGEEGSKNGNVKKLMKVNYGIERKNLDINDIDLNINKNIVSNINQGDRILVKTNSNIRTVFETYSDHLNNINKNYRTLLIANNISPEEYISISRNNPHIKLITRFDDDIRTQLSNIEQSISHIKQLLTNGQNVFVVVYNIDDMLQNINLLYSTDRSVLALETIEIAKKLLSLGRNINGNASVTIVATHSGQHTNMFDVLDRIVTKKL